ncbi:MAG: hypothetical protein AB7O62_09690 [Pirellulales bacterium]
MALLLAWWNLIYTVPFLLAVTYLGIYTVSGLTFGEHDIDPDADLDGEIDANAEIDAEHDLDGHLLADGEADHDLDADHDLTDSATDAEHSHPAAKVGGSLGDPITTIEAPFYLKALSWLGLGRVPMSIVLMVLLLSWGAIGFIVNQVVDGYLPGGAMALLVSVPLAGLGSASLTRLVVRVLGRWLPTSETSAEPWEKLVGCTGEALYDIDHKFGLATVRNRRGDLFQVPVRVYEHKSPLPKGARLLLVDYDRTNKHFLVTEYDLDR